MMVISTNTPYAVSYTHLDELVEAARIDGCSDFGIFMKVILPVIKPAMASWGAITLIARWNDFFWP